VADLYKYGVAVHIYKPIIKRGVVDFAVGADWTPAAGDVKISKDGGAAANVTNLPTAITMGNTAMWDFSLTATEMQAAKVAITVADSATKAVEDNMFELQTYGNASAQHVLDLGTVIENQVWDALRSNHQLTGTTGLFSRGVVSDGTAQAGSASSITLGTGEPTTVDIFKGAVVVIYSGTGAGQARMISAYSSGRVASVVPNWVVTPDNTSKYITHAYADPVIVGADNKVILSSDAHTGAVIPTVTALTNDAGITQTGADKVWSTTTRALTDKVGFALSSAGIQAIWDALTSVLTTASSIGKLLVDNINATISSRATTEGIKKNTAYSNFHFMMFDSTTGAGKTGIADGSFTKKVIIDNGTQASLSGTITEVDSTNFPGLYRISLTSGELNGDNVTLRFAASGAKDSEFTIKTSP